MLHRSSSKARARNSHNWKPSAGEKLASSHKIQWGHTSR